MTKEYIMKMRIQHPEDEVFTTLDVQKLEDPLKAIWRNWDSIQYGDNDNTLLVEGVGKLYGGMSPRNFTTWAQRTVWEALGYYVIVSIKTEEITESYDIITTEEAYNKWKAEEEKA